MSCLKVYQSIKNGESNRDIENHIENCGSCKEMFNKVNETMTVLDDFHEVPGSLSASILKKKGNIQIEKLKRINFSSYIQIAAAIVFGVFIGHQFGKNANTHSLKSQKDPIDQYLEAHHLNLENSNQKNYSIFK